MKTPHKFYSSMLTPYLLRRHEINPLLLDYIHGCKYAYSAGRSLRGAYTGNIVKLRRSSDSTQLDFKASGVGQEVSEPDILAFAAGSDLTLTKLYDQSGAARDLTPVAVEPVYHVDYFNLKPAFSPGVVVGSNSLAAPNPQSDFDFLFDGSAATIFLVLRQNTTSSTGDITLVTGSLTSGEIKLNHVTPAGDFTPQYDIDTPLTTFSFDNDITAGSENLITVKKYFNSSDINFAEFHINGDFNGKGKLASSPVSSASSFALKGFGDGSTDIVEAIFFNRALNSAEQKFVEVNICDHYNILIDMDNFYVNYSGDIYLDQGDDYYIFRKIV